MATVNFGGQTLVEFTSDVPVVFDKPINMYVTDDSDDFTGGIIDEIIVYDPRRVLKAIGTHNAWRHCFSFLDKPEPRRATWLELAKWCLEGKGLVLDKLAQKIDTGVMFKVVHQDKPVDNLIKIRKWGDTEWHEPTIDYMETKDETTHTTD